MKKLALLVAILMLAASPAFAICGTVDSWISEQAHSDSYLQKAGGMVLEGVHQVVEAPIHLLKGAGEGLSNPPVSKLCPKKEVPGYVMGLVGGTFNGTYAALENVVAAAGNVVYALIPNVGPLEGHVEEMAAE